MPIEQSPPLYIQTDDGRWVAHPGALIRKVLVENEIRPIDLARAMGISAKHLNQILHGFASVTPDVALRLEESLGYLSHFPGELDAEYWGYVQLKFDLAQLRAITEKQ